jgi:hypothetical protein
MTEFKVGDQVYVRECIYSDCFGMTGTILEIAQSALFGPRIQRCKVDFKGKIRRILSIHLRPASKQGSSASAVA